MTKSGNASRMHKLVKDFRDSGLSQKEFAATHGLTPGKMHYWVSKLARPERPAPPSIVPKKDFVYPSEQLHLDLEIHRPEYPTNYLLMISTDKITEIFCLIDDFCIELDQVLDKNGIDDGSGRKRRNRASKMSQSEVENLCHYLDREAKVSQREQIKMSCLLLSDDSLLKI